MVIAMALFMMCPLSVFSTEATKVGARHHLPDDSASKAGIASISTNEPTGQDAASSSKFGMQDMLAYVEENPAEQVLLEVVDHLRHSKRYLKESEQPRLMTNIKLLKEMQSVLRIEKSLSEQESAIETKLVEIEGQQDLVTNTSRQIDAALQATQQMQAKQSDGLLRAKANIEHATHLALASKAAAVHESRLVEKVQSHIKGMMNAVYTSEEETSSVTQILQKVTQGIAQSGHTYKQHHLSTSDDKKPELYFNNALDQQQNSTSDDGEVLKLKRNAAQQTSLRSKPKVSSPLQH